MLVLALDTATPVVTAGLVELPATAGDPVPRASRAHDGRKHGEVLMPAVRELCAETGVALADVDAVVAGVGPGPFTGLRVGIVSAAALGDALGIPVHGVCSLDAIAVDALATSVTAPTGPVPTGSAPTGSAPTGPAPTGPAPTGPAPTGPAPTGPAPDGTVANGNGTGPGNLLVTTDARRRETYWAVYDPDARRLTGPSVEAPLVLAARLAELGVARAVGDPAFAEPLGIPVGPPSAPSPAGLVAVAADALRAGREPAPLEPLYLRRPDAVEPTGRKRVTAR